jgi:thiamine biosynthesis protein ThiI
MRQGRPEIQTKTIIKYGELWLKSEPVRRRFLRTLADNVRSQLKFAGVRDFRLEKTRDMLLLECTHAKAKGVLTKVFGVSWFAEAHETTNKKKAIEKAVLELAKTIRKKQTFAIRASRSDKTLPFTSKDIENEMGAKIKRKVNLSNPDVTIFIEMRKDFAYVYSEKIRGAGGLPCGVTGRVLSLVSGGIDSPVASWLMMKRGCAVELVHFASFEDDENKVESIARKLREYSPVPLYLHMIPFTKIQETIASGCETRMTCVLCKRLMYRTAEALASEIKVKALVTGENLAQVASQTLDNLLANNDAVSLPLLRPLLTMDKEEIITLAKKIGTYELSIKAAKPCKFVPRKPATKARNESLLKEEKKIRGMKKLVKEAVAKSKKVAV